MTTVGELFIALGFQVDDKKLKGFNDELEKTKKSLVAVAAGATATVYAINRFLNEGVRTSTALKNFEEQTGYAREGLLQFFNVASRANTDLTLEDTISAYKELGDVIAGMQRGEFPEGAAWMNFGLDVSDTPDSVIQKIRDAMPRLLKTVYSGPNGMQLMRRDLGTLGLEQMQQAFLLPQDKWDEWRKKQMPTPEQWKAMERMAMAYREFKHEYFLWKMEMGTRIAPYFQSFVEWVSTKGLPLLTEFTANLTEGVNGVAEFLASLDGSFLAGVIGALALLLLRLNPVGAAITTIIGLLHEFGAWRLGKDNIFSDIQEWADNKALPAVDRLLKRMGLLNPEYTPKTMLSHTKMAFDKFTKSDMERLFTGRLLDPTAGTRDSEMLRLLGNIADASKKAMANQTFNTITVQGIHDPYEFKDRLMGIMNNLSNMPKDATLDGLFGASGQPASGGIY